MLVKYILGNTYLRSKIRYIIHYNFYVSDLSAVSEDVKREGGGCVNISIP